MTVVTKAQLGAIHALKRRLGLDEALYRSRLQAHAGVASAAQLTLEQAATLIDGLKRAAGQEPAKPFQPRGRPRKAGAAWGAERRAAVARTAAQTMTGRYAPILRALWIAGWNLGVVRDRDDAALIAFVERQTGLSHPRFLIDPAEAAKAVEGLKAMLAREASVEWPKAKDDPTAGRIAVLEALWRRGLAIGALKPSHSVDWRFDLAGFCAVVAGRPPASVTRLAEAALAPEHLDEAAAALGRKIRKSIGEQGRER